MTFQILVIDNASMKKHRANCTWAEKDICPICEYGDMPISFMTDAAASAIENATIEQIAAAQPSRKFDPPNCHRCPARTACGLGAPAHPECPENDIY